MILSDGVCSIFGTVDKSPPGGMPDIGYEMKTMCFFGVLDFATAEAWPTDTREAVQVDARIRILQDRSVTNRDVVVLQEGVYEVTDDVERYEVTRAFHGHDDESGQPITDLTLRRLSV